MGKDLAWFVVMIPIVSHQSLVLMPLTSFHMSPVCSTMETPIGMDSHTMSCLSKWAIAGVPYGIPMCCGGAFLSSIAMADNNGNNDSEPSLASCLCEILLRLAIGCAGALLSITGICMIAFWMLGGPILGFWITFGSWDVLFDLGLIKIFGVTSVALASTASSLAVGLCRSRG